MRRHCLQGVFQYVVIKIVLTIVNLVLQVRAAPLRRVSVCLGTTVSFLIEPCAASVFALEQKGDLLHEGNLSPKYPYLYLIAVANLSQMVCLGLLLN